MQFSLIEIGSDLVPDCPDTPALLELMPVWPGLEATASHPPHAHKGGPAVLHLRMMLPTAFQDEVLCCLHPVRPRREGGPDRG